MTSIVIKEGDRVINKLTGIIGIVKSIPNSTTIWVHREGDDKDYEVGWSKRNVELVMRQCDTCGIVVKDVIGCPNCTLKHLNNIAEADREGGMGAWEIGKNVEDDNLKRLNSIAQVDNKGLDQNVTVKSLKKDDNKYDPTMLTIEMVELVSRVRMFGAKKYARGNFKITGFKYTRSLAAAMRHILAFLNGEDNDPESGLSHLGHAICSIEHCIYDIKHHPENDDRKS